VTEKHQEILDALLGTWEKAVNYKAWKLLCSSYYLERVCTSYNVMRLLRDVVVWALPSTYSAPNALPSYLICARNANLVAVEFDRPEMTLTLSFEGIDHPDLRPDANGSSSFCPRAVPLDPICAPTQ
jgi:hypothetical protein